MMNHKKLHLDTDETIIFSVRKHWFVLILEIIGLVLVAVLPVFLYGFATTTLESATGVAVLAGHFIAGYCMWLMGIWMALFSIWTNYYLDVWTLTNKRFIAVDQHGLFSRTTASFRLERLQDVIMSVQGIIPTFLGFGTLEVQTAGEERNFKVFGLPNPEALKADILEAAGNIRTTQNL